MIIISIIAGIFHGLGFETFNSIFFSLISIALFYFITNQSQTKKQIIINTLVFGCSYYIFSLHWIVNSLLIDVQRWFFVIPIAITLIPLALSTYYLIVTLPFFYLKTRTKNNYLLIFAFSGLWVLSEFLKSTLFTGFPWNILASIWIDSDFGILFLRVAGIYATSFATIFFTLLIYNFATQKKYLYAIAIFCIFTIVFLGYENHDIKEKHDENKIKIRLVQPSVKQKFKWKYHELEEIFEKLIKLSFADDNFDIVIWPETAFPFQVTIEEENEYLKYLSSFLKKDQLLITGAMRVDENENSFNSMIVVNSHGEIVNFYDKKHLVPFGEYIPFQKFIKIDAITNLGSLTSGDKNKSKIELQIKDKKVRIFPLICYEGIFPFNIDKQNTDIDFVLNITNDGWFGNSFGPYQHLRAVRLQAILSKKSVIRVANNGITTLINKNGKIEKKMDLNKMGYLDLW